MTMPPERLPMERLQKVLAQQGIGSRREVERWIESGRVRVNGAVAELGQKIDPQRDRVQIDQTPVKFAEDFEQIYILLHKPKGVVSTCYDPQHRRTVLDLLPFPLRQGKGIHPVGRLDSDSTGALLLTNNGDLTFQLTHPSHDILKTYRVWVEGYPHPVTLDQWRSGVQLQESNAPREEESALTLPAEIEVLQQEKGQTCLKIQMREGRNRQIRRIAELLGHPVLRLHRLGIGAINLGDLHRGQWRNLTPWEVESLSNRSLPSSAKRSLPRRK
ncbi:MAG: pseudouridine synthase [Prochlorotrichaceae cyanobacterium]